MTTLTETEPTAMLDHTELIASLAADAEYRQPRRFAVYGIYRATYSLAEQPFLGWGIDFGDDEGAIFWEPGDNSTHHSSSARQVLEFCRRLGEAHLRWLD